MYLSNRVKFPVSLLLFLFLASACGDSKTPDQSEQTIKIETRDQAAFSTREPEEFSCELVEKAGETTRRLRVARKGEMYRIDYDFESDDQRTVLRGDKYWIIDHARSVFLERDQKGSENSSAFSELTHELLNRGRSLRLKKIREENGLTIFAGKPNNRDDSEFIVYFDESIGLPTKQEMITADDNGKTTAYSIEMFNFTTTAEPSLFLLPDGLRKVSDTEFYRNG